MQLDFVETAATANTAEVLKRVKKYQLSLLVAFLDFIDYVQTTQTNFITLKEWMNITTDQFTDYRTSSQYTARRTNNATPHAGPVHTLRSSLDEWKKGVKRDMTLYPTLKHDHQFDTWNRETKAVADTQGLSNVLDPKYTPTGIDTIALFKEQKTFMFAVFNKILLTDQGKKIVRAHEIDSNAQVIYEELRDYSLESTRSSLDASKLLTHITSSRINDGNWRGTTHGYLLHWQDQVRKYHTMVPRSDNFHDNQLRTMIQNAVKSQPALQVVQSQANQFKVQNGKDLSYQQYCALLESAAVEYDDTNKDKPRASRKVYSHDLQNYDIDYQINTDDNPSEPPDTYDVNRASMTREQWTKLDGPAQTIWDSLTDEAKAIILDRKTPNNRPPNRTPHRPRYNANLHDMSAHDLLSSLSTGSLSDEKPSDTDNTSAETDSTKANPIIAMLTEQRTALAAKQQDTKHPGDITRMMSTTNAKQPPSTVVIDGHTYSIKMHRIVQTNNATGKVTYQASSASSTQRGALIDRGSNGGVAGDDVRIIRVDPHRTVDVEGIDNHRITDIRIVTAGAFVETNRGPVILIMNQYAHAGKGKTIHSSGQMEWFKNGVDDRSKKVGGQQRVTTPDGYIIPINIVSGLPYIQQRPYTDAEYDKHPHVFLTSDSNWNPSVLDYDGDDDTQWYDTITDTPPEVDPMFDEFGNIRQTLLINRATITEYFLDTHQELEEFIIPTSVIKFESHERSVVSREPDYARLRPFFGYLSADTVKRTFAKTTQHARMPHSAVLQRHHKAQFPALNVTRRNEPIATDYVYSDTPAVDDGSTGAQFYVGTHTNVCDVYGCKTDGEFLSTLQENVRRRGAPTKLVSDRAQSEISKKVLQYLRALVIDSWQSEPHRQNQNPSERRYQTVKRMTNTLLDRSGSPASTWLLCMCYVCFILNHTVCGTHNDIPMTRLTGSTPDISPLLRFHWWEEVFYKIDDNIFPSESREAKGHFVGISEHVGHAMTFKILTADTKKIIHRSGVRTAADSTTPNLRADLFDGETDVPVKRFVQSKNDENDDPTGQMVVMEPYEHEYDPEDNLEFKGFDPSVLEDRTPDNTDIIGKTFLMEPRDDGQRFRAKIVEAIEQHEDQKSRHPKLQKFRCSVNDNQYEEIFGYNEIVQFIEQDDDDTTVWKYRCIKAHEGPLTKSHPNYKGSLYNVLIEWENGEITNEPLTNIAADDPVSCAIYGKKAGLLEHAGWKRFKSIAKQQKKLFRMANQAKLRSFRTAPKYMYGFEIPRDYAHAIRLDSQNGSTKWQESTVLEMEQLASYYVFTDKGIDGDPGNGFKKIRVHLVYAVKHDGRHKARLVADGHLTEIPVDSVYSGVVSLRGLRLILFLSELNDMETWATDIGNAYLEAVTDEKVYIIGGPEFGHLQGHVLVVYKALYGLRSSGVRWYERFSKVMKAEGFTPCKLEPEIWMRRNRAATKYEYVAVYVDDLALAMDDPKTFLDTLTSKYSFKLKGSGEISFHLGCDFFRDEDGTLCMKPEKYISKVIQGYEQMFGRMPKRNVYSPLEKGDHPELDTSELCNPTDVQKYQSLIGTLQWAVSIGRIDITTAVMTLSSFRAVPRLGHLERAKRVISYLARFKESTIRFRTLEPDYSDIPGVSYDWIRNYDGAIEDTPDDAPPPLGKFVVTATHVDANLCHDLVTGKSVSGILHWLNGTPIDWFSKKQGAVETATYGSEFMAARLSVEQIKALRDTLRYLGVPLRQTSYMFGDNKSVVDSSMRIDAKLHKRHTALSFHKVREAIAAGMIIFQHIPGALNAADILSKHWDYAAVWTLLRPLLFWKGDPASIPQHDNSRHVGVQDEVQPLREGENK
jgi:hypothetical protein